MAEAAAEQSQRVVMGFMYVLAVVYVCVEVGRVAITLSGPVGNDPTNPAIKQSAVWVPILWMTFGISLVFTKPSDVRDSHRWDRIGTRFGWPCACGLCLLHIAVAFHLGHSWSHEAAWEHTRQTGGYGDGIYVNYAFALVWLIDAIWLCVAFDSYFARPRWLHWTIHGFLAFVVFNAAVVFGSWPSRIRFMGWFLMMGLAVWYVLRRFAAKSANSVVSSPPDSSA